LIDTNDLKITLADVSSILLARQCSFHLTGGLASSFYGEPRFTQGIDIVIRVAIGESLDQLIQDLSQKFIVDRAAIEDAVRHKSIFQVLHEETMIKVDFHVGQAISGELERSHSEEILAGVVVPIVSKEDAILSKLIWICKGSNKSRHDVKTMLKRSGEIDFDYLNSKATALGVESILKKLSMELDSKEIS
jgi:Nucleotidyl transferase AbiEii toxin, Type IV TA system